MSPYPVPVLEDGTPMSDEQMADLLGQSVEALRLIRAHYDREQQALRDWEAFAVEERTLIDDTRRGLDEETRARRWKELTARQWELHRIVPRPAHLKVPRPELPDDDDVPEATPDQESLEEIRDAVVAVAKHAATSAERLLLVQMLLIVLVLLELYRLFR
jgi:hypothetical protein